MERFIIQEIKAAQITSDYESLEVFAHYFPEELKHAAVEHWVGSIIFQPDEHE